MAARDEILRALRAAAPPEVPLPDLGKLGASFADLPARFAQSLTEVGGTCVHLSAPDQLEAALQALPAYAEARRVVSLVPGVARANVDLASLTAPHQTADVEFCLLPGALGVAENGAVCVAEHGGPLRAVAFLTQHLGLVLHRSDLVADLHQACQRVAPAQPGFSLWISGPSKTADIEQALVIGAHGPRSCTVFLVDAAPPSIERADVGD